jgi:chitinase
MYTHIYYTFFAPLENGTIVMPDEDSMMEKGVITKLLGLKSQNRDLKIIASIGGTEESRTENFVKLAASQTSRDNFAASAENLLKKYGFDGIDIHWIFPEPSDRDNLVLMLKALSLSFKNSSNIITISVGPTPYRGEVYDIPAISQHVNLIILMAFDLHGIWEGQTGSNAALYAGLDPNPSLNVDACVRYWRSEGAPDDKIVLGISTYGKTYTLADPAVNGINSPATGLGKPGPITKLSGTISNQEIIDSGWIIRWLNDQKVPYAYIGDQWVSYENVESVKEKAMYIKSLNLAGAAFQWIDFDDFHGKSGLGKFPLVSAGRNEFDL